MPFGLYDAAGAQVEFARVVTDRFLFAYLRDVFVLKDHRGRGLGTWLTELVVNPPDLATATGWLLATDDAHAIDANLGFRPLKRRDWYMQMVR